MNLTVFTGAAPLAVGTVLALAALSFVLWPLVAIRARHAGVPSPRCDNSPDAWVHSDEALRDIEFDRQCGKVSDRDYAELHALFARAAARTRSPTPTVDDLAEAAILRAHARQRTCVDCGPRSEPDATYCSHCGRYLPGRCPACAATVKPVASSYCSTCGTLLSALASHGATISPK